VQLREGDVHADDEGGDKLKYIAVIVHRCAGLIS
jgi:hypothetical protein